MSISEWFGGSVGGGCGANDDVVVLWLFVMVFCIVVIPELIMIFWSHRINQINNSHLVFIWRDSHLNTTLYIYRVVLKYIFSFGNGHPQKFDYPHSCLYWGLNSQSLVIKNGRVYTRLMTSLSQAYLSPVPFCSIIYRLQSCTMYNYDYK